MALINYDVGMRLFISNLIICTFFSNYFVAQIFDLGNQKWDFLNLDVTNFRNGDEIPEARTDEEWEAAGINEQPAWCYINNDTVSGKFKVKLYNWYAVNDARGLAPDGYHIPTEEDFIKISFIKNNHVSLKKYKSFLNTVDFKDTESSIRFIDGSFFPGGNDSWWSLLEQRVNSNGQTVGWGYSLDRKNKSFKFNSFYPGEGLNVICIKD